MSLSTKILIGLGGGIACGLFAGEYAAGLSLAGDAFFGFLQMTVLPYIVVSLIANIGRLSVEQARRLLRVGGTLLAVFLAMGTVALFVIPISFPKLASASFFSRSLVEPRHTIDVVGLYLPVNPFNSLSAGTVPAIVVFCIFAGVGLIPVNGKSEVIRILDSVTEALIRINKIAVGFTPVGVFAIAAATAGTMTLEEIGRLQTYLLSYSVAAVLLTFVILPAMVTAMTPFQFRDIFRVFGSTLLLIFVTGKLIVVMPQLIDSVKELFRERAAPGQDAYHDAEVLIPLIYPFPNLGTFVIFMFLPFTAWFAGRPLELADYPVFLGATLLVSFVSPLVGIPYLLDLMKLPNDMFHLFIASSVYTDRVRVVLGGMHIFVFTVIAVSALHGMLRIRWGRVVTYSAGALALVIVCVFGVRGVLSWTLKGSYTGDKLISRMRLLDSPAEASTLPAAAPNPVPVKDGESLLNRIRRRGVLRFGYDAQRAPFCFVNSSGEVVGFDVELMHRLAKTLGVRLEFVPVTRQTLAAQAAEDHFDLAGCGFTLTAGRSAAYHLSAPYLDLHAAFVVPDYLRHDLDSIAKLAEQRSPAIGVASDEEFAALLKDFIPQAKIVRLEKFDEFIDGRRPEIEALFTNAETGSALSLLHPDYTVVSPADMKIVMPAVFVLSKGDEATRQFLNDWIFLREKNGMFDRLYNYWILGKTAEQRGRRWSIVRNVLGWVP